MFVSNSEMICYMCYYKFLRRHADKRRDLHLCPMPAMHVFFSIATMTCGQNSVYPKFVLNHYIYHVSWKFIGWRSGNPASYLLLFEEWAPLVESTIELTSHVRGGSNVTNYIITIHVSYACIFSFIICFFFFFGRKELH